MKISPFTKSYGEKTVLTLPEFELEQGKIYAVIGGNGSGFRFFHIKVDLAELFLRLFADAEAFAEILKDALF